MSLFHTELPKDTAICPYCKIEYDIHGFHGCGSTGEIIAARDQEWVQKIEQGYTFIKWTGCSNPDCNPEISKRCKPLGQCPYAWWQQLKKDMGVSQ